MWKLAEGVEKEREGKTFLSKKDNEWIGLKLILSPSLLNLSSLSLSLCLFHISILRNKTIWEIIFHNKKRKKTLQIEWMSERKKKKE